MSILIPLGLLGLLSIIGLILIYIIKPNYQQKRISSSYVWKLSLKYKKKTIPVSRLSQIIIFICQLLVLALCAVMLAKPAILEERVDYKAESVVIIDASASMMVSESGESRFERAVSEAISFAEDVMDNDGVLSIIVAEYDSYFLAQRSSASDSLFVLEALRELYNEGVAKCTYGSADLEGAIALAEEVLDINSNAKVYLYTDTQYINTNGIEVKSFAAEDEWNAAILNCTATVEENNFYSITVDVGCYAKAAQLIVRCDIFGINDDGSDSSQFDVERVRKTVFLDRNESEATITFTTEDFSRGIYSFKYLHAYIEEDDSFEFDNDFYFYGGQREKIRIQYASSEPNNFLKTTCRVLRTRLKSKWDIEYTFLRKDQTPENKGYDIYIYEHTMPDTIPTDGIVLLLDPDKAPTNAGFRLGDRVNLGKDATLGLGEEHAITKYIDADKIGLAYYKKIVADGYDELLYYAGDPVMLVKNEDRAKIVVCTFNLNYSDMGIRKEFPLLIYNIFNYFLPSTVNGYAFEIGETLTLNARGSELSITAPESQTQYLNDLPYEYRVDSPGAYTLTQTLINGNSVTEHFFVKVPSLESNIANEVDSLPLLHVKSKHEYADKDLLMYFAAAMFAILFIEWLLQAREYFR